MYGRYFMPKLPSGIELAISKRALFDHGGNWFKCPDGHFWYWFPDPEMGDPPFDANDEILQVALHAPVPKDREEAKHFVYVLELDRNQNEIHWRGEWLAWFPRYTELDARDLCGRQRPDRRRPVAARYHRLRDEHRLPVGLEAVMGYLPRAVEVLGRSARSWARVAAGPTLPEPESEEATP